MSVPTLGRTAARDSQRAFVALLSRPLVTPGSDPELHRQLTRNHKAVSDAARRLGYRVAMVGRAIRLVRVPAAGVVTRPTVPLEQPGRRVLALTCVLAAACEDTSGGATLAKLSDLVAQMTTASTSTVTAYDPASLAHRRHLLRAAHQLEHWGVLRRRTRDERLLDEWTEGGAGIGAGYDIDRDALMLLTSPDILALALDPTPPEPDQLAATASLRALRALVETPAVLYGELPPEEADTLRLTRGLRSADAVALTGGIVEPRAEGLLLILPDDPPSPGTVDWPKAAVSAWVALLMADLAGRAGSRQPDGTVVLTDPEVDDVAEDLHRWHGGYMNRALREDIGKVRPEAETQLRHLGLLRTPPEGGWVLSPVAGRYRDPDVVRGDDRGVTTPADKEMLR